MWIEIITILIVWPVILWFGLKLVEDIKLRRQRRRYDVKNDPGQRSKGRKLPETGVGFRTSASTHKREPVIQDALRDAKQELLSGGVDRLNNDSNKPSSSTELNYEY